MDTLAYLRSIGLIPEGGEVFHHKPKRDPFADLSHLDGLPARKLTRREVDALRADLDFLRPHGVQLHGVLIRGRRLFDDAGVEYGAAEVAQLLETVRAMKTEILPSILASSGGSRH